MTRFRLQFDAAEIRPLAARYRYGGEREFIRDVATRARRRGWFRASEFRELVAWKTGNRSTYLAADNSPQSIRAATRRALAPDTPERERLHVLRALRGVDWPVASVVLHFGTWDCYPILDVRALEALGYVRAHPAYSFSLWWDYVETCRALASERHVRLRTLDRALWQWSKEQSGQGTHAAEAHDKSLARRCHTRRR